MLIRRGICFFLMRVMLTWGDIRMNNVTLNKRNYIKFLGINVENHLTFVMHFGSISTKVSKGVGLIFKLNNTLPLSALKSLYYALIHSHLVYGIEIYFNTFSIYRDRLILQKHAISAIHSLNFIEHTNKYLSLIHI